MGSTAVGNFILGRGTTTMRYREDFSRGKRPTRVDKGKTRGAWFIDTPNDLLFDDNSCINKLRLYVKPTAHDMTIAFLVPAP